MSATQCFWSVVARLMLTFVTCHVWFKENLLRSVGRPFCVHEIRPLFCDASFDLTVKTIVLCQLFFSCTILFLAFRRLSSHLRRMLVPTIPLFTPNLAQVFTSIISTRFFVHLNPIHRFIFHYVVLFENVSRNVVTAKHEWRFDSQALRDCVTIC